MASIRKKSNGMWLAQVRRVARDGLPALNRSASFPRKAEAEAWAAKIENEWRTLRFGGAPNVPFSEVLERYKNEVSVHKHGWRNETNIINRVLRTPLAEVRLPHLSELQFQAWADERKKEVSTSTLRREWVLLSNVLTVASKQWRWLPENFMQRLDKPADGLARTQRVTDEDAAAVAFAGGYTPDCVPNARTQRAAAAFYFALETAMRAGVSTHSRLKAAGKDMEGLGQDLIKVKHTDTVQKLLGKISTPPLTRIAYGKLSMSDAQVLNVAIDFFSAPPSAKAEMEAALQDLGYSQSSNTEQTTSAES